MKKFISYFSTAVVLSLVVAIIYSNFIYQPTDEFGLIDRIANADVSMSYEHNRIHRGDHYYACGYTTLASGASTTIAVSTPDEEDGEAHMYFTVNGSGITTTQIYEGISTTSAGTAITPINNNRDSFNVSALEIFKDAHASTTYATVLEEHKFGNSSMFSGAGGSVIRDAEIILKENEIYYWKITSGAADNIISYCGEWYEVKE